MAMSSFCKLGFVFEFGLLGGGKKKKKKKKKIHGCAVAWNLGNHRELKVLLILLFG